MFAVQLVRMVFLGLGVGRTRVDGWDGCQVDHGCRAQSPVLVVLSCCLVGGVHLGG